MNLFMQYMTDGVLLRETLRDADLDQYRYYTCTRFDDEFSCVQHQLLWQMHNAHPVQMPYMLGK